MTIGEFEWNSECIVCFASDDYCHAECLACSPPRFSSYEDYKSSDSVNWRYWVYLFINFQAFVGAKLTFRRHSFLWRRRPFSTYRLVEFFFHFGPILLTKALSFSKLECVSVGTLCKIKHHSLSEDDQIGGCQSWKSRNCRDGRPRSSVRRTAA